MQTITRKLWFSAGHRVHGHEGECANLHGHNYNLEFTAWAPEQDSIGRIIDFKVLKNRIDPWIQENWDHGFLWWLQDPVCRHMFQTPSEWNPNGSTFKNYPCEFNPTAENIALFLLRICNEVLLRDTGVTVIEVVVHETDRCSARQTHPAYDMMRWPDGNPVTQTRLSPEQVARMMERG